MDQTRKNGRHDEVLRRLPHLRGNSGERVDNDLASGGGDQPNDCPDGTLKVLPTPNVLPRCFRSPMCLTD